MIIVIMKRVKFCLGGVLCVCVARKSKTKKSEKVERDQTLLGAPALFFSAASLSASASADDAVGVSPTSLPLE